MNDSNIRYSNYFTSRYSIDFDLINNSDSTICFWMLTCNWQANFLFNDTNIYFYSLPCDGNYLKLHTLLKGQKMNFKGDVCVVDSNKILSNYLKLGFRLIQKDEDCILLMPLPSPPFVTDDFLNKRRLAKPKIIWSEAIQIN